MAYIKEPYIKNIQGFTYLDTTKKVWTVVKVYPTGKQEEVLSFFDEKMARELAGILVGTGEYTITLKSVNVVTKMTYRKGVENLPLREINTSLKALVVVYNLRDNDNLVIEKQIDYANIDDRKWLGRITFWALTNHHSVETISMDDAEAPTMENK